MLFVFVFVVMATIEWQLALTQKHQREFLVVCSLTCEKGVWFCPKKQKCRV